jgi:hypothetical protein
MDILSGRTVLLKPSRILEVTCSEGELKILLEKMQLDMIKV